MKFMKKMREVKHGGASFWYTDNDVCEDIDIDDDVEELEIDLDDDGDAFWDEVDKVFPNVKKIHINENVYYISMKNSMFPNVREVTSDSPEFYGGDMLVEENDGTVLLNTFCKKAGEVINLDGIDMIAANAFNGCESINIINTEYVSICSEWAFKNSAVERLPFVNGVSIIDTVFKNSVEAVVKITIGDRMTVLPYAYAFAMHGDETLLHKACRGYFANGSAEMKSQIDSSFMLGNNDDAREIMAEKMYMMDNSNDAAKTFLQQHSMKIVKYVCDRNSSATKKERILTNYTRLDMLSDDTLHYVLEYANDNNMPILAAEVLDRINKNEAKNNNPEHTFRI